MAKVAPLFNNAFSNIMKRILIALSSLVLPLTASAGYGMMGYDGTGYGYGMGMGWFMSITWAVYLLVGILLIVWLWQNISKK